MKVRTISKIVAAMALPVLAASNAMAYTSEKFTPEANQAAYWGTNCVKYEDVKSDTYTAPADATKVIIKGGTLNAVYTSGSFTNLTAATNPNNGKPYGISHVIVCVDSTPAPATPVTPVTPVASGQGTHEDTDKDALKTPDVKHNNGEKEDKNQSACNPSDTNSANLKHRDDGVNCTTKSEGKISDEAAAVMGDSVKVEAVSAPERIATTGGLAFLAPFIAGGVTYGGMLLRRRKA